MCKTIDLWATSLPFFPLSSLLLPTSPSPPRHLNANPVDANHDIHALLLGRVPLVAESSVLLRVPEGADGAVHAAAALGGRFRRVPRVLDDGAVGDVLVVGLGGGGRGGGDEGFEEGVLRKSSMSATAMRIGW